MPSVGHDDRGPSLADLAPIVRQERLRRGLSAEQAGKLGGISKAGWQHIEAGTAKRYDHWRIAVAKAFDWPENWPDNPPDPPEVTRRDDEVLQAFAQLGETMLAAMESMQRQIGELQSAVDQLAAEARPARPGSRRQKA